MPQRAVNLVLVVGGVAAVAVLLVLGVDLARAANRGPRWKQRILGAGLVLLMAMGFAPAGGCTSEKVTPAAFAAPATPAKELSESKGWQRILAAWKEAEEIISGKRGDYPFDKKGQKKVLENLKQAEADAAELQKANLLSEPEAGLLLKDLGTLTTGVQAKRPTEVQMATCYKMMPMQPSHDSFQRLSGRLPLLEKLAAAETLHREVAWKVLVGIEADIATLAEEESLKEFAKAEERQKAEKTRDAAKAAAKRLRERIMPQPTCYVPMPPSPPVPAKEQSRARQEALERFAADTLHPDVLRKAAANTRRDHDAS